MCNLSQTVAIAWVESKLSYHELFITVFRKLFLNRYSFTIPKIICIGLPKWHCQKRVICKALLGHVLLMKIYDMNKTPSIKTDIFQYILLYKNERLEKKTGTSYRARKNAQELRKTKRQTNIWNSSFGIAKSSINYVLNSRTCSATRCCDIQF